MFNLKKSNSVDSLYLAAADLTLGIDFYYQRCLKSLLIRFFSLYLRLS